MHHTNGNSCSFRWVAFQEKLSLEKFNEAMIIDLEILGEAWLKAFNIMKENKHRISKAYNKKVETKSFK